MLVLTDFPQEDPVEKSAERAGRDKQYWRLGFANFGFNDGLAKLLATHKRTDVPDFDRCTKTSRGESLTVGTKGHTTNVFGVSL